MAAERVERRLTAILAADVAGCSRLMGADEEGTLAQLKAHRRALVDPKIIHCRRAKNGTNTDHPLTGRELRGLRKLKAEQKPPSRYIFMTERGSPFSPDGFYKLMIRLGEKAKVASARPHRLRHSCGFKLANDGRDTRSIQFYLGHSDIRSTCRYTDVVATRFEGFFED